MGRGSGESFLSDGCVREPWYLRLNFTVSTDRYLGLRIEDVNLNRCLESPAAFARSQGVSLDALASPGVGAEITAILSSLVPLVPPLPSYNSTCSRTQSYLGVCIQPWRRSVFRRKFQLRYQLLFKVTRSPSVNISSRCDGLGIASSVFVQLISSAQEPAP
jgi:hypothetical protein